MTRKGFATAEWILFQDRMPGQRFPMNSNVGNAVQSNTSDRNKRSLPA